MIEAVLHDAGTRMTVERGVVAGMDRATYRQVDMEESVRQSQDRSRAAAINTALRDIGHEMVRPWPERMPRKAPIDVVPATEGLDIHLYEQCGITRRWAATPAGRIAYTGMPRAMDRDQWRPAAFLTPAEMRALEAATPSDWVRLPIGNEPGLGRPMSAAWYGIRAPRFALVMPDNNLWTPFDLTRADWYAWVDDSGRTVDGVSLDFSASDRMRLVLYLRPRTWRWFARVIAHFLMGTPFETVRNDEVFLKVWFDRPPFHPHRHELPRTLGNRAVFHPYEGTYLDYDRGIDYGWRLTRAFGELQSEILQQQYFSLCVVYIFESAEPAAIAVQRVPPKPGDIVCGVGIRDQASGVETRLWALQRANLDSVYPLQTVTTFWGDFWA